MMRPILSLSLLAAFHLHAQQGDAGLADLLDPAPHQGAMHTSGMPVLLDEEPPAPAFELVSFEAIPMSEEGVLVRFSTLYERPEAFFMVERSRDLLQWHVAAELNGDGPGEALNIYEVLDDTPFSGVSYYRLTRVDDAGALEELSDMFSVRHESGMELLIHADHKPGHFMVHARGTIEDVRLLNNRGQFVPMQMEMHGDRVLVNAEQWPQGTYYVHVTVNGTPHMRPVIISGGSIMGG